MIGFLQERPGVYSSARLVAVISIGVAAIIGLAIAFCLVMTMFRPDGRDGLTAVIGAGASAILPLGGSAWTALRERNASDATEPKPTGGNGT